MSNSVEILIEADNQASKTFEQVTKDIDENVKNIKGVGEKAKKSTEFVGVLANALGGSELGAYAQQLAGITDKVSQFSEVSKAGGAGALAFKAGLVAIVAVAAFKVGQALRDIILDTKRWTEELAAAEKESLRLADALAKVSEQRFRIESAENAAIRDPAERMQASKNQLDAINGEIDSKNKLVNQLKANAAKIADENAQTGDDFFGFNTAGIDQIKKTIAETEKQTDLLRTQRDVLVEMTTPRAQALESLKQENALKDKSESYIEGLQKELDLLQAKDKILARAQQNTFGDDDAKKAAGIASQIEAIKTREEADKKADAYWATVGQEMIREKADLEKKTADQKAAQIQKIADLKQNELDKLAEEKVMLTQGKEAAHAFNLEKQGLSREDAKSIASQQAANDKLRAKLGAKPGASTSSSADTTLQASETRLLTRGDSRADAMHKIAEASLVTLDAIKTANEKIASKPANEYEKVGD